MVQAAKLTAPGRTRKARRIGTPRPGPGELLDLLALAKRHHHRTNTESIGLEAINVGLERLAGGNVGGRLIIGFRADRQ